MSRNKMSRISGDMILDFKMVNYYAQRFYKERIDWMIKKCANEKLEISWPIVRPTRCESSSGMKNSFHFEFLYERKVFLTHCIRNKNKTLVKDLASDVIAHPIFIRK